MMIYFIILGGIAQTLVKQLCLDDDYEGILNYEGFYITIFWIINFPFVIMK